MKSKGSLLADCVCTSPKCKDEEKKVESMAVVVPQRIIFGWVVLLLYGAYDCVYSCWCRVQHKFPCPVIQE